MEAVREAKKLTHTHCRTDREIDEHTQIDKHTQTHTHTDTQTHTHSLKHTDAHTVVPT